MATFVCVFEDKKFSNFLPLSLSQPVFELRIGFYSLRTRIERQTGAEGRGALCREYLGPLLQMRDPNITVNTIPAGAVIFVNGRLLCYGGELRELLERLPDGSVAVKGGYVVAARLSGKAAADFASYVRWRISDETIGRVCEELKGYVTRGGKGGAGRPKKRTILLQEAPEGTYEDDHAIGQDGLAEKLPKALVEIVDRHGLKTIDFSEARLLSFPWQIIEENPGVIEDDFQSSPFRGQSEEAVVYPGAKMVGEENVLIGEGAVVKPGVVLDASSGPIVINDGATVMPNAVVVGPAYIGKNSLVKPGARILEGTSIGDVCKVGGEVAETIFGSYSNKQHDGFVGHSYIGEWVNIGAGGNNSDLKNNYSAVRMWCAGMVRETGRQFLGFVMGDHTKLGIGALLSSGTAVGFNCNLYGSETPPRFVPSFSWGRGDQLSEYELEKAMLTAQIVMERRDVKFSDAHRLVFRRIFELSKLSARNI